MLCRAKPYEGTEPYIFFSYCHKNAPQVYPIIEKMTMDGYRIWYDDGIHPGDDWLDVIAQHLTRSAGCIAAITPESASSHNCRNEINLCMELKKPVVSVMLTDFAMSYATRLQLGATQYVRKYDYASDKAFYEKFYSASVLSECRGAPIKLEPISQDIAQQHAEEEKKLKEQKELAQVLKIKEELKRKEEEENCRADEEKRKAEEEKRRADEEKRKAEEEKRRAEEEQRKAEEEKRRAEEEQRKSEEKKRRAEEEQRKAEEEKRRADEEKRKAEEASQKKAEEVTRPIYEAEISELEHMIQAEEARFRNCEQELLELRRKSKEEALRKKAAEEGRYAHEQALEELRCKFQEESTHKKAAEEACRAHEQALVELKQKMQEEAAQKKAAEEACRACESVLLELDRKVKKEERAKKEQEGACRVYESELLKLDRKIQEEETRKKATEASRRIHEQKLATLRRKAEEERKRRAEEERRRAEEEQKRRAEEERRRAEEERKRRAEEERRRAEEERKRRAEEERRRAEEERKRRAEEEWRRAEEERKRRAEEEWRRAEEERKRRAEEEWRRAEEEEKRNQRSRQDSDGPVVPFPFYDATVVDYKGPLQHYLRDDPGHTVVENTIRPVMLVHLDSATFYSLYNAETSIGRSPVSCDIFFPEDHGMSRHHADIIQLHGNAYLRDMRSGNGTFVNNIHLEAGSTVQLENGSVIQLHDVSLLFLTDALATRIYQDRQISLLQNAKDGSYIYLLGENEELVLRRSSTSGRGCFTDDPKISRGKHALLSVRGGQLYIKDLQSRNGTYINEQRLEPYVEHPLYDGAKLRIGDTVFSCLDLQLKKGEC